MKRRDFLTLAGAGTLTAGAALSGCNNSQNDKNAASATGSQTASATPAKPIHWKMVTTWPKNFPGLGTGANNIAKYVDQLSNGRLKIEVFGAGEIVPALEVFDAVSAGTAQMGHGGAYYWQGKMPAAAFFTSFPFGLTADEMNSWLFFTAVSTCGPSCTSPSASCRCRPATPGCRWAAGSASRSTRWPTSRD